jgi:2-oxoglutarate/2-oxoacid ferredoxin oxidoreductase subunit alpha
MGVIRYCWPWGYDGHLEAVEPSSLIYEEEYMTRRQTDLAWRIGGPQGSGVDTAAGIFARACAIGGLHLFGRRDYYSNIMGRHSYYDVRVARHTLTCHRDTLDLLTTFEPESLSRHLRAVAKGGGVIYDVDDADTPLERIPFLDERVQDELRADLEEHRLPCSTAGLIAKARQRGVDTFAIPFDEITHRLARELRVPQAVADRALNTIAVAVSCALLHYDRAYLAKALAKVFPGRTQLIEMNIRAVELAYAFVRHNLPADDFPFHLAPESTPERRLMINGNQAVALGKLAAGMTFQTYYPISPATDESVYLEAHETVQTVGGDEGAVVIVQTEDELAAVTMASGAALTGARSATATSGPGFSLMAEGLGWAGINEVPLVVTLYQRGGPSTGMPTRSEQGDLQFAIHAGHGEFPRIVMASGDLHEAFADAAQAFNYAERYQMLVIHLLDKALASTTQTVQPFEVETLHIEHGELYAPPHSQPHDGSYARFAPTASGISPRALLGQSGGTHWLTGGEHTVHGRVTEDAAERERMMEKRARKLALAAREIPAAEKLHLYGHRGAAFTIVSWGSTKGGILEALERLADEGIAARLVQVHMLWPFPTEEMMPLLDAATPLVIVESNFSGQLAQLLREQTGRASDYLVVKYNGRPMSGLELYRAFASVQAGTSERRVVLRNPYE